MKVYFAGELFSLKHILGNAAFGAELHSVSEGRYTAVLPQDLEQRETTPESIRNQDLKALIESDVAIFNFDGDEIDSGTVLEYAFAKFCDIPSVVVRTDFRAQGDQIDEPWNLMLSFYPRTKVIIADAMAIYQKHLRAATASDSAMQDERGPDLRKSVDAGILAIREIATQAAAGLDEVVARPAILAKESQVAVYTWATQCAGQSLAELFQSADIEAIVARKDRAGA